MSLLLASTANQPITVTTDEAGIVMVNVPPETGIGLNCTWFSVEEVRNGVTLLGGVERFESVTVSVVALVDVFDNTSATVPLVLRAAVDSNVELLEVDVSSDAPGRIKRLNWPIV